MISTSVHCDRIHTQTTGLADEFFPALDTIAGQSDPAQTISGSQNRALLDRALAKLDADKRDVFVLFELECLDMREVAEMVGCPLNTVLSRMRLALEKLRRLLEDKG